MSENAPEPMVLQPRPQRWRLLVFGLVTLVAGMVAGGSLTLLATQRLGRPGPPDLAAINDRIVHELQDGLDLTEQQCDQIDEIVGRRLQALHEIREQARPKVAEQMNLLHQEIMAVLDEDQQVLWNENVERLRERLERGRAGRPGHRSGKGGRMRGHPPMRPFNFWEDRGPDEPPNGPPPEAPPPPADPPPGTAAPGGTI